MVLETVTLRTWFRTATSRYQSFTRVSMAPWEHRKSFKCLKLF